MDNHDDLLRLVIERHDERQKPLEVSVVADGTLWTGTVVAADDWLWKIVGHWTPVELEDDAKATTDNETVLYIHLMDASGGTVPLDDVVPQPIEYLRIPLNRITTWWVP
ncbi:hypothetical protein [Streptomyces sp. NPDC055287]